MVRIGTKSPKYMAISYRASATKMLRLADRQHHVCCLLYLILFRTTDIREFTPFLYDAPGYSRFGHSLNALDGDGDGIADVMILAGGFSPVASNDVWITADGINWCECLYKIIGSFDVMRYHRDY